MTQSKIAIQQPTILELEAGDYYHCTCGLSSKSPFCDGSHKGTDFVPQKFTIEEKKKVALCECKKTQNAPYCDGSHTQS